jgi:hypothetical protein
MSDLTVGLVVGAISIGTLAGMIFYKWQTIVTWMRGPPSLLLEPLSGDGGNDDETPSALVPTLASSASTCEFVQMCELDVEALDEERRFEQTFQII